MKYFTYPIHNLNLYIYHDKGIIHALNIHTLDQFLNPLYEENILIKKGLDEYFIGKIHPQNIGFNLEGTSFQKQVWSELLKIPFGYQLSYKQVAEKLGDSKKARAVANAIGKNPILILVPCHRVIANDGTIGGFSAGLEMKQLLLKNEGVTYELKK